MSKLRIEKLKQGVSSNNDVLVFRNDLGTFQGQSNVVLNTITLGSNTVNSSVYTGTAYLANNTTYLNGQLASYYANSTVVGTAYSNAVSTAATDASTKAGTAYTNAVSTAATDASSKAATAYSNATSYADTKAATAYSNAISYSGNAALAYANAIAYAASNTYVNSTFAPLASPTFTGVVTVSGNLVVNGNTFTVNTSSINVTDSLLYLASNNEVSDTLDIGFVGHYNNGSGANGHTGLFRSATQKKYYLFQNYQPEFLANNNVDVSNTATGIQMADLVVGNLTANSTLVVTGSANVGSLNTTGTVSANVLSVSNVEQTQTNLQVDPAGSAFLNAIIYG